MAQFTDNYLNYSLEQLKSMPTRQLLAHYKSLYSAGDNWIWEQKDWDEKHEYQALVKSVLDTREHIPNKLESKAIRKARKKKGK